MILHELLDYQTLRVIWWLLLGVLLIGFAVMDGFDLGTGMLLPFGAMSNAASSSTRSVPSGKAIRCG
jgi:cytochrome d ubiquinol oxidase subunit II